MNEQSTVVNLVNQYLNAVREQLSGLSQDEVDSIVDDLREHIDASLRAHGDQPTRENVEAVLAGMDPPESFAPDFDVKDEVAPKVSRTAIFGAVLLPFGILMVILTIIQVSSATEAVVDGVTIISPPATTWWQWILRFTILPLGIISPFATTILGLISISQIRASKGKQIGKTIALLDALFYPLLILDGLLLALLFGIIAQIPDGNLALTETLTLMSYFLVLIVDLIIVAITWAKIR